jgi:hypothetical protein
VSLAQIPAPLHSDAVVSLITSDPTEAEIGEPVDLHAGDVSAALIADEIAA